MSLTAEIACDLVKLVARAEEQGVHRLFGEVLQGGIKVEAASFTDGAQQRAVPALLVLCFEAVDCDAALAQREIQIGHDTVTRDADDRSKSGAMRACACGVIEGEHAGLQLAEGDAMLLAGVALGKFQLHRLALLLAGDGDDDQVSLGQ